MSKAIKGFYDGKIITITPAYIQALKNLIIEKLLMMREGDAEYADCWTWGECEVGDLASNVGLSFQYGGEEDKPKYMRGVARVIVNAKK